MAAGKRKTGSLLIILAIILIVVLAGAAFLLKDQLFSALIPQKQGAVPTTPPIETVDIVVLEQPLTLGEQITPNIISLKPIPKDSYTEGLFFIRIEDVIGKRARYPLQAGIPLTTGLLSEQDPGSYIGSQIPAGYVAIPVPITALSSVSYALRPGDHVNVIASLLMVELDSEWQSELPNVAAPVLMPGPMCQEAACLTSLQVSGVDAATTYGRTEVNDTFGNSFYVVPSESQRPRLVSQTLIQDAIVLLVGKSSADDKSSAEVQPTPTPVPSGEGTTTPTIQIVEPDQITIMVSPQDAITLNYLVLAGAQLNLVMRSPADNNVRIQTEAVTLQFIMEQYRIPLPAKLTYGLEPRKDEIGFPTAVPTATPRP
jgi:Flp pilus assembly protein CpaB